MPGYVQKNRTAFRRLMQMFRRGVRANASAVCDEWLMRANFEAGFHDGIRLERGDFLFGREETARLVGIGPGQVRTVATRLVKLGELTIRATSHGSIGTWCQFDTYVEPPLKNHQQPDHTPTNGRPSDDHSEEHESNRAGENAYAWNAAKNQESSTGSFSTSNSLNAGTDNGAWWSTNLGRYYERKLREVGFDLDGNAGTDPRHKANLARKNHNLAADFVSEYGEEVMDLFLDEAMKDRVNNPGAFLRQIMVEGPRNDEVYKAQNEPEPGSSSSVRDANTTTADEDLPF